MNLPNKLTVSRIVLSVIVMLLLLFPFYNVNIEFPSYVIGGVQIQLQYIIAGVFFIIASITDALDGHIARRDHLITETGKMLDAIADKILVNSVLIILGGQGFIPLWIPVIIITRDVTVNAMKMQVASKGKVVAAIKSGKIKTAFLMTGIALTLFYNLPFQLINIQVSNFCLYFATIMSVVSMIEYYNLSKQYFKEKDELL